MLNPLRLSKLTQEYLVTFSAVLYSPSSTLEQLANTLVYLKSSDPALSEAERVRLLWNRVEKNLRGLIDECHITRTKGDRSTAVYSAV